jgi:proteasome activator subunit 4
MFSEAHGGRFEGEHSSDHVLGSTNNQHRFTHEILSTNLPKRRDAPGQVNPEYQAKVVELHGAILGATALVEAFPYTVPKFLRKFFGSCDGAKLME